MPASRQIPHIYQQLYHTFSQRPIYHQERIDRYGGSIQLGNEEEEEEAADLKAEKATVGVVQEAA